MFKKENIAIDRNNFILKKLAKKIVGIWKKCLIYRYNVWYYFDCMTAGMCEVADKLGKVDWFKLIKNANIR